jgi:hypothetical protein
MTVWHLDILRNRSGGFTLCAHDEQADRFEFEKIASTSRGDAISGLRKLSRRMGRPNMIVTDHAQVWTGLPATIGASHRYISFQQQARLSLLERQMRAEDRR